MKFLVRWFTRFVLFFIKLRYFIIVAVQLIYNTRLEKWDISTISWNNIFQWNIHCISRIFPSLVFSFVLLPTDNTQITHLCPQKNTRSILANNNNRKNQPHRPRPSTIILERAFFHPIVSRSGRDNNRRGQPSRRKGVSEWCTAVCPAWKRPETCKKPADLVPLPAELFARVQTAYNASTTTELHHPPRPPRYAIVSLVPAVSQLCSSDEEPTYTIFFLII